MDQSLKQRLIGAAVLVALAVIFLPMLLQGPESDQGATQVPLEMPTAPDREFETRELPLAPPAPVAPEGGVVGLDPDAMAQGDPNRVATVDAGASVAPRMDALEGTEGAPAAAGERSSAAAAAPAPVEPERTAPAAATPPAAPAADEPIPAAQAGGRYVVNLGSYANSANASALVSAFKGANLPAYAETVTVEGKSAQRVRLGPFGQRSEAEAARLRARQVRADVPSSVVALDAAVPAPSAATATASTPPAAQPALASVGFAVQVGAFRAEGDANGLRDRLRRGGFSAFSERVQTENGTLWRVRVGPTADRAAAESLKAKLPAPLDAQGMVVSHP